MLIFFVILQSKRDSQQSGEQLQLERQRYKILTCVAKMHIYPSISTSPNPVLDRNLSNLLESKLEDVNTLQRFSSNYIFVVLSDIGLLIKLLTFTCENPSIHINKLSVIFEHF